MIAIGQEGCEEVFVKQKKTKKKHQSEILKTTEIVQTKRIGLYRDNKRSIWYSFLKRGDSLLLEFKYIWIGDAGSKSSFELGQAIEIAFIFEDSTYDIITFENPPIYPPNSIRSPFLTFQNNYNFIKLTPEFFEKLRTVEIAAYEIKNPTGVKETSNDEKTKSQELKRIEVEEKYRPIIINYAKCFYEKVSE
jgi:hypothetical protein